MIYIEYKTTLEAALELKLQWTHWSWHQKLPNTESTFSAGKLRTWPTWCRTAPLWSSGPTQNCGQRRRVLAATSPLLPKPSNSNFSPSKYSQIIIALVVLLKIMTFHKLDWIFHKLKTTTKFAWYNILWREYITNIIDLQRVWKVVLLHLRPFIVFRSVREWR